MKLWIAKSEDWVVCEDYPSYMINREGQVKSNLTNKILKPSRFKTGYMCVGLRKDGKSCTVRLHRLLAKAFIPNIENKDKVVLLWGNHDHSYFFGERCSGWSYKGYEYYDPVYDKAFDDGLFDLYYIYDDIIMTHAGVSEYWLKQVAYKNDIKDLTWDDVTPKRGMSRSTILDWNMYMGYDSYGDTISQSPIWIRPNSLIKCPLKGYRQIVGHTNLGKPTFKDGLYINDLMPDYYIIIEDGEIEYVENKFKNYDNNN